MRGRFPLAALVFVGLLLTLGCGQQAPNVQVQAQPPGAAPPPSPPQINDPPGVIPIDYNAAKPLDYVPVSAPQLSDQERYDGELLEALEQLRDGKLDDALASFEAARAIQDTDQVRNEIARLKQRIEQEAAAEKTILDISAVLSQGQADQASKLAAGALQEFSGTDSAVALMRLKRQADALLTAQLSDNTARKTRFKEEADAAVREKNLRAAALALEQALQFGDDADLGRQLDEVRAGLLRYDDARRKAAELRRDPANLEDAIAALQDAARAWDTPEVRAEIDQCQLALQKRRERVGVADFEVRGDVGIPDAGREVAEELLPAFKVRFDVVEREQLGRVVEELKLDRDDLFADGPARQEVARLAKVRYLVLGSVSPVNGITVHARLVDVRTGLIVQTAKIVAPDADDVLRLMPQLANMLLMSDEQRIAHERKLAEQMARQAPPPPPPAVIPPPPPPEVLINAPPPPPIVVFNQRPPDVNGIRIEDFDRLPPPPPQGRPLPPPVILAQPPVFQDRMLAVSLELGDNLFRRGKFREAFAQFEFAANVAPGRQDVLVRLDRCRPKLPPPGVVINIRIGEPGPLPLPPPPPPRLAVLNLIEIGNPAVVPPGLGAWTAENLAPYFSPPYQVVDRGEVYWWMGRLGMTMRDLMTDPGARRWLGRALNVRFFVIGSIRETASFNVCTHLLDAEYGFEVGRGKVHCHGPIDLKLKLCELARQTLMSPEERLAWEREQAACEQFVIQGRQCFDRGDFVIAVTFYEKALKCRPGCVEFQVQIQSCRQRIRQAEIEAARRAEWERQQAIAAECRRRQWEMAQAAETARLSIRIGGGGVGVGIVLEKQRTVAYDQMFAQAQAALKVDNFALSIQLFESAVALQPNDDGYRQLAQARARQQQVAQARAAQQAAARDAALKAQREQQVIAARAQVEKERRDREAAEAARIKVQQQRDAAEYQRLVDLAEKAMAEDKHGEAIVALQTARNLKKTPEVERLLGQALAGQARVTAEKKGAVEKAALEQQLALEKSRREAAEAEAARNRELYAGALKLAQAAMAQKQYDDAIVQYTAAKKYYPTDAVLTGLQQAQKAKVQDQVRADADRKKAADDAAKQAELTRLLTAGNGALTAGNFAEAAKSFGQANKLVPGNVEVLAGLSKSEQMRDAAAAKARLDQEEAQRNATFTTLLTSGKANLQAKQYAAAVAALSEAVKLKPADAAAKAALADAEKARDANAAADAASKAEAKRKADEYQKLMGQGRLALSSKQYDAAVAAFAQAQKLLPGDQASSALIKEAEKGKGEQSAALAAEAKLREDRLNKAAELNQALAAARAALAGKDLTAAEKQIKIATALAPKSPDVVKLQADLDKAQDAAKVEAAAQRKRMDQYQGLIRIGQQAMAAKDYAKAADVFADATRLVPGEPTAAGLLKQAEAARVEAEKTADAAARKKAEDERLHLVQQFLTQGRAATAAGKFDEATRLLAEANKLAPADANVDKALAELEKSKRDAAAATAAEVAALKKALAAFEDTMKSGRAALQAGRFAEAAADAQKALTLMPGDKEAIALQQAAAKGAAEAKSAADAEAKKKAELTRLMTTGQQAMAAKKYDDAIKAAQDALKVVPGDPTATALLTQAQRADAAADGQAKLRAEYAKHMTAAQQAMAARKYEDAAKAATEALKLMPADKDASALLLSAQRADAAADAEAKNKVEFARLVTLGQQAMAVKNYDAAAKAAQDALKLAPGDPTATALLQSALKADATADAEAKRKADYTRSMTAAQQAMVGKKYDAAVKAAQDALKVVPGDPAATALLQQAQKADTAADADAKRKADHARLMTAGQQAMAQKKFDAAVQAFTQALALAPADAETAKALADARKAVQDAAKPVPPPPADFAGLMKLGDTAMAQKKFDLAVNAYGQALKLKPTDKAAAQSLKAAQDAAKKAPPPR